MTNRIEKLESALQGSGYTEAEEDCKGCMGPCGVCENAELRKVAQSDYDEGGSRLIEKVALKKRIRELEEALRMGIEMRAGQKAYFRTREGGALDAARKMEQAFDKTAAMLIKDEGTVVKGYGEMPTLFPG